jgi:hypothetical protein
LFVWRNALILGLVFIAVGVGYYIVNNNTLGLDLAGATMLVVLGFAMAFVFTILLRGSREL